MQSTPGLFASLGLLIARLAFGGMLLLGHGLGKLMKFDELKDQISDPLGLIPNPFAFMALFGAEFFCAALVILGLLTRVAAIPIVYAMAVAAFVAHSADPWFLGPGVKAAKEPALLYMFAFVPLVFTGPGLFSVDAVLFGRRRNPDAI